MFYNSTYDLDRFRTFVFQSTLLERFEVDDDLIHEMQTSDEALLRFGFWWVRFALFGEPTMRIRPEAIEEVQEKLEKRVLSKKNTANSSLKEAQ